MHSMQYSRGHKGEPQLLYNADQIDQAVKKLGQTITNDYQGRVVTLIGILKGSFIFMSDLAREIDLPVMTEFMSISSYGEQTKSTGIVKITGDLKHPIENLDVIIVEDIVDTGLTAAYLLEILSLRKPRSLRLCSLLHKPSRTIKEVPIDYLGITIEDKFVVGYGLDYEGLYRNLNFIGYLPDDQV